MISPAAGGPTAHGGDTWPEAAFAAAAPDELVEGLPLPLEWPEPPGILPCWHPGTGRLVARYVIAAEPGSCKEARDFVAGTLRRWEIPELRRDAVVVISELVTNALRHAGPHPASGRAIEVVLSVGPSQLVCAVADSCRRSPVLREPDHVSETGRGLHVVAGLSDAWGWLPLGRRGKAVWAVLGLPGQDAGRAVASCEDDNS